MRVRENIGEKKPKFVPLGLDRSSPTSNAQVNIFIRRTRLSQTVDKFEKFMALFALPG